MPVTPIRDWGEALMTSLASALAMFFAAIPKCSAKMGQAAAAGQREAQPSAGERPAMGTVRVEDRSGTGAMDTARVERRAP